MAPKYQPGTYKGKVTTWSMGKAGTGTPQFAMSFWIIGMVNPNDPEGELVGVVQEERTVFRAITDKTVDYFLKDLERLGYTEDSFAYLDPNAVGAHDFKDVEVTVQCHHDTYKGQLKEKWEFAWGGGGFQQQPLEQSEVQKLDALFGRKLKERAALSKSAENRRVVGEQAGVYAADEQNQDIPF